MLSPASQPPRALHLTSIVAVASLAAAGRRGLAALGLLALLVAGVAVAPAEAQADAKGDARKAVERASKDAMEHYDLLEYEDARRLLNQAVTDAKKAGIDKEPLMAGVQLNLGIVYAAGLSDNDSAKQAFRAAAAIDADIEIPPAYRTPDLTKLLAEAKSGAPATGKAGGEGGDDGADEPLPQVDCATVEGLKHEIEETATAGKNKRLVAFTGADLAFDRVSIQVRGKTASFKEIKMTKTGDCAWVGTIPAAVLADDLNYYYVAAYKGDELVASVGSSGAPNILSVEAVKRPVRSDDECESDDPPAECFDEVGPDVSSDEKKVYVNVFVGTGGGYTSGKTEQIGSDIGCCFAPAYFHVAPELGVLVSKKFSLAVAGRFGLSLGANIPGHATLSPAGFLRGRYHVNGMSGLSFFGDLGVGVVRNVIKVVDQPENQNKDLGAAGPLLVGAGVSAHKTLGGGFRVGAEAHLIGGIPVVDEFGTAPNMNFGIQADLRVGIGLAF